MPIWSPAFFGSAGSSGFVVEDSIWLDGSADELTFTPSQDGTGAGKKYTLSFWTKIIDTESTGSFFCAGQSGGDSLHIQTDWSSGNPFLNFNDSSGGSSNWLRRTGTRVLRDPTAWMHICFAVDNSSGGGLAGTANAARVYINGAEDTSFTTANSNPPSSDTSRMTMQYEHVIGNGAGFNDFKSFYLAEFVIVDGQQLTPASFGEYDDNGVWIPINVSGLTFGNNGCYLNFKVAPGTGNGAGTDVSGNNNHFTDVSLTAAQQVTDTCTDDASSNIGNYTTFNPIDKSSNMTLTNGNLTVTNTGAAAFHGAVATQRIPNSGKYYFEVTLPGTLSNQYIGVVNEANKWDFVTAADGSTSAGFYGFYPVNSSSSKVTNGSTSSYGGSIANSSVLGFAIDKDNDEMYVSDDGAYLASSNPVTRANPMLSSLPDDLYVAMTAHNSGGHSVTFNFGQTAFAGTIPTGFVRLNTANLPAPTVTKSDDFFQAIAYAGSSDTTLTVNTNFQADFVWIKDRSARSHQLFDIVRGAGKVQYTDGAYAQDTNEVNGYLDQFNSTNFRLTDGSTSGNNVKGNGNNYVAFCWKAGGSASSNTDGTITSEVTAASHGGFSIAKYTGTGANATFGHGCSRAPKFILIKAYEQAYSWAAWHEGLTTGDYVIYIDGAAAESNQSGGAWQSTPPSSSVVTLGSQTGQNGSSQVHVCYSFARTPGLIGIGNYTGNGSADGPMIVVDDGGSGFKPAWLMIKSTASGNWNIVDAARDPFNRISDGLRANSSIAEFSGQAMDFLANGFKLRLSGADYNTGSQSYIYLAFAETPFGGDGVAQARAR